MDYTENKNHQISFKSRPMIRPNLAAEHQAFQYVRYKQKYACHFKNLVQPTRRWQKQVGNDQ